MLRYSLAFALLAASLGVACDSVSDTAENVAGASNLSFAGAAVDTTLTDVDALGYEVELTVDDAAGTYAAAVEGTYAATARLEQLALDFDGNDIDEVTVGGAAATFVRREGQLVIDLPKPVARLGQFSTRIVYRGSVAQADGADRNDFASFGGLMVRQRNAEGKRIYTSLNWPSKARRWLPLRDHPRDVAQVAFKVTFPKRFTVLANGRLTGTVEHDVETKTWSYEATTPMPAYDFHIAAYEDWKVTQTRSASKVPIATYTYAKHGAVADAVYRDLGKGLDFYEKTLGKYRWGTASFIEEPIFGGGMEHASVVSMDETLFSDPAEARAVALHELAHHWSGNLVHFRQWNDLWLSEGFADYLTLHAIAQLDGAEAAKARWRQYYLRALLNDFHAPHPLAPAGDEIDPLTIFDDTTYKKGAFVLRMLEHIVGEAKMAVFLRGWFDRHGAGAAVASDDLLRELSDASGRDLTALFDGFVRGAYHPEIDVTLTPTNGGTEVNVAQVQKDGPADGFRFPLDLELHDGAGTTKRITIDLTGKTTTEHVDGFVAASVLVDPDEVAFATTTCGPAKGCRDGYACAGQRGGVFACVPR